MDLVVGTAVSGELHDTWESGGSALVLAETTGTPGFTYDFTFGTDNPVPGTAYNVILWAYYQGNPAHNVKIQQWQYGAPGSWQDLTAETNDFPSDTGYQDYSFPAKDFATYLDAGVAKFRITHTSAGNPTHRFYLDYLHLAYVGSATESASESRSGSASISPSVSESLSASRSGSASESVSGSLIASRSASASESVSRRCPNPDQVETPIPDIKDAALDKILVQPSWVSMCGSDIPFFTGSKRH